MESDQEIREAWRVDRWRIFYADGREFDSRATSWEHLPSHGVLGLKQWFANGRTAHLYGRSLYWHDPDTGVYANDDAADALLPQYLSHDFLKRGQWISTADFKVFLARMAEAE